MKKNDDYYYSLLKYLEVDGENNIPSDIKVHHFTRSKIFMFKKEIEMEEDKKLYRFINLYLEKNNVFKG